MAINIDLHTDSPEAYVAEAAPLDLAVAVQHLAVWDDWACQVADYLFNAWVLALCLRRNDREGLDDLEFALHATLERSPAQASLPATWRARWQGYVALLEARLLQYASPADIETLLARKHVKEMLVFLNDGEASQTEIRNWFQLSHERLSQVLRHLESHGLIHRRKEGKENRVSLSSEGKRYADMLAETAAKHAFTMARRTASQVQEPNGTYQAQARDIAPRQTNSQSKHPAIYNADAYAA